VLDVNAVVAVVWDPHIHHAATRKWFAPSDAAAATCPLRRHQFLVVDVSTTVAPRWFGSRKDSRRAASRAA
jgi:uncharacterized protein